MKKRLKICLQTPSPEQSRNDETYGSENCQRTVKFWISRHRNATLAFKKAVNGLEIFSKVQKNLKIGSGLKSVQWTKYHVNWSIKVLKGQKTVLNAQSKVQSFQKSNPWLRNRFQSSKIIFKVQTRLTRSHKSPLSFKKGSKRKEIGLIDQ